MTMCGIDAVDIRGAGVPWRRSSAEPRLDGRKVEIVDAVESLTWVATRVTEAELTRAREFVAALGLEVLVDDGAVVFARTARGDVVEYCGPGATLPAYLFATRDVATGFLVADAEAAAQRLVDAGFARLSELTEAGPVRYVHVAGPRGDVVGLLESAG
jgi:hypothetical protein